MKRTLSIKIMLLSLVALFFFSISQAKDEVKVNLKDVGTASVSLDNEKEITTKVVEEVNNSPVTKNIVYNDVKSLLNTLGTKTDTVLTRAYNIVAKGSARLWDILVTQQKVKAYYQLGLLLLELILCYKFISFFNYINNTVKPKYREQNAENALIGFDLLIGICVVALFIFGWYNASHSIDIYTGLFNPEYGALEYLFQVGKSLK